MSNYTYQPHESLLREFAGLFIGHPYIHRDQSLGNHVAAHLYEDLFALNKSGKLTKRVTDKNRVLNRDVRVQGMGTRRGDGSFGEILPSVVAVTAKGFRVSRGPIARVEIGAETKILAKAMNKQIDRVIGDLTRQVDEFKASGGSPICVAFVGVNHAAQYTSFEGDRNYPTDGKKRKHPIQEAATAIQKVLARARQYFDEMLFLPFDASNVEPFDFKWQNLSETRNNYSALLLRVSDEYEKRF